MKTNMISNASALSALFLKGQAKNVHAFGKQNQLNPFAVDNEALSRKKMLRSNNAESNTGFSSSVVQDSINYANSLRMERTQKKDTSLQLKKLKYSYKSLSSKISSSKTSTRAKQVASEARREAIRLKRQAKSGEYDEEEVQAAITHAQAMERVAKKKARHLEEEELVKTTGGVCEGDLEEKGVEKSEADEGKKASEQQEIPSEDIQKLSEEFADDNMQKATQEMVENAMEEYRMMQEIVSQEMQENAQEMMTQLQENMQMMADGMDEMFAKMGESLKDLLEEFGISEDGAAVVKEMDPSDLKKLKIKHRTEEQKALAKADGDYLKAIFKHYENMKSGNASQSAFGSSFGGAIGGAIGGAPAMTVSAPVSVDAPVTEGAEVDISL